MGATADMRMTGAGATTATAARRGAEPTIDGRRLRRPRRLTLDEHLGVIRSAEGLTSRDVAGLAAACAEAMSSDVPVARVGCAVMVGSVVVATAHNSLKTDPAQKRWNRYRALVTPTESDPANMDSIHAEVAALKSIPWPVARQLRWPQARVYVFRVAPGLPLGQGMARPCRACWQALRHAGVRHLVYSTDDGFAKEDIAG